MARMKYETTGGLHGAWRAARGVCERNLECLSWAEVVVCRC